MPMHLLTSNRRTFLAAASVGLMVDCSKLCADETEGDLIYLLNDTHIGAKQLPTSPVPSHLRHVVTELEQRKPKPACVIINGDLALKDGQPEDYLHFAQLISPLRAAEIDVHLTLGNHDHRQAFYDVMKDHGLQASVVDSPHVSIVSTRHANFFLLDTLKETMIAQGIIGPSQLLWLATALDAHADKPAIVVAHHNPRLGGDALHFPGGLIDSNELWDILTTRRQVKAYIHGHVHDRNIAVHKGIYIINSPATSYVADPNKSTTGWTTARLTDRDVTLTTHTTDPSHPWNGQSQSLNWLY